MPFKRDKLSWRGLAWSGEINVRWIERKSKKHKENQKRCLVKVFFSFSLIISFHVELLLLFRSEFSLSVAILSFFCLPCWFSCWLFFLFSCRQQHFHSTFSDCEDAQHNFEILQAFFMYFSLLLACASTCCVCVCVMVKMNDLLDWFSYLYWSCGRSTYYLPLPHVC